MQPSNNAAHNLFISTGRSQVNDTAAAPMVFCALLKDTSVRMQSLWFMIHLESYLWSPGCCKSNIPSPLALLKLHAVAGSSTVRAVRVKNSRIAAKQWTETHFKAL